MCSCKVCKVRYPRRRVVPSVTLPCDTSDEILKLFRTPAGKRRLRWWGSDLSDRCIRQRLPRGWQVVSVSADGVPIDGPCGQNLKGQSAVVDEQGRRRLTVWMDISPIYGVTASVALVPSA